MNTQFYNAFQPQTTDDGSDTLYSVEYRETFHSTFGALTETKQVFLEGSGVVSRLEAGLPTRVLEIGFGTGLNFWTTAQHSLASNTPLEYVALEKYLLPAKTLARLNHGELPAVGQEVRLAFLAWRTALPDPLTSRALHWTFGDLIRLDLIVGDATIVAIPPRNYHAIYQDAFSPEHNPELWSREFFARLFALLAPSGKLATYSAKGEVRRRLAEVGFQVQKQPGPPGKREITVASKP